MTKAVNQSEREERRLSRITFGFGVVMRDLSRALMESSEILERIVWVMVLAITAADPLKRARVLPEIRFVEELRVLHVLATDQPVLYVLERPDIDEALSFEIPGEVVARTEPVSLDRHAVLDSLPCGREGAESPSPRSTRARRHALARVARADRAALREP